jgi:hypothetical protein
MIRLAAAAAVVAVALGSMFASLELRDSLAPSAQETPRVVTDALNADQMRRFQLHTLAQLNRARSSAAGAVRRVGGPALPGQHRP